MCPRRRLEIGQEYLDAQRYGQSYLLLTYQRMVSSSANAHVDQLTTGDLHTVTLGPGEEGWSI